MSRFCTLTTVLVSCAVMAMADAEGPLLGMDGTHFTLDGKPVFLLGASYYGALGMEDEDALQKDLDDLAGHGFNWLRVWATWEAHGCLASAVESDGAAREPFMTRLERLCHLAGEKGMVVDVTVSRGLQPVFPDAFDRHLVAMRTLAERLKPYRNVYFDIGNERNVGDARYVPMGEVKALVDAVKAIDPERLCTASDGGDINEEGIKAYLESTSVDFICPHRPRHAASPAQTADQTQWYLAQIGKASRVVPLHYQEPFRRGYGDWEPKADDFLADLEGARKGGAAGWCFHNGSTRTAKDGRPRRSFDMRASEGRLFEQLDEEERAFLATLKAAVKIP